MPLLASDPARNEQLEHLRDSHPVFRVEDASAAYCGMGTVRLEFRFTCGDRTFSPSVELAGLRPEEVARVCAPTARRLVRALAIVEAFSYWKAFCSPVIEAALPSADPAETAWWESFWPKAMGEFFYRNGIDFTTPGFLRITASPSLAPTAEFSSALSSHGAGAPPLVMFSGGKDSLALAYAVRDAAPATEFFLYNPTEGQRALAESMDGGGRIIEVRRHVLPELLALNASGHPNGHTPYSAYLALAALLVGCLRGSPMVLAGNSRSDDEPNVGSYLGMPVNHQWTKSHEFEVALGTYRDRWLPGAPLYSSPLRPLLELQIIRSLEPHVDAYLKTASCNKTKGLGWCRKCAKCAWVFLATSSLFGHDLAVSKTGGDLFADPGLSGLYAAMSGLPGAGDKPFECTGTEEEVRSAIQAAGQHGTELPALAACLRAPAVQAVRPLDVVLKDWGQDDLLPAPLQACVRRAAHL